MRAFVAWMVVSLAAGGVGALASGQSAAFYAEMARPSWAPPAQVFGPVWTTLYVLMGLAAGLVANHRGGGPGVAAARRRGLRAFVAQLALNALWTWLFFAWREGALAFVDIVLLLAVIVWTMTEFARVRPVAAWLLAPYLSWVGFASALNFAIWRANPGLL